MNYESPIGEALLLAGFRNVYDLTTVPDKDLSELMYNVKTKEGKGGKKEVSLRKFEVSLLVMLKRYIQYCYEENGQQLNENDIINMTSDEFDQFHVNADSPPSSVSSKSPIATKP